MHAHSRRRRKLTEHQAKLLWLISKSPLMATLTPDGPPRYHLQNGKVVNRKTAEVLISDGWLVPMNAGLFEGIAQSWCPATFID
jgi:hypothetical protein